MFRLRFTASQPFSEIIFWLKCCNSQNESSKLKIRSAAENMAIMGTVSHIVFSIGDGCKLSHDMRGADLST